MDGSASTMGVQTPHTRLLLRLTFCPQVLVDIYPPLVGGGPGHLHYAANRLVDSCQFTSVPSPSLASAAAVTSPKA